MLYPHPPPPVCTCEPVSVSKNNPHFCAKNSDVGSFPLSCSWESNTVQGNNRPRKQWGAPASSSFEKEKKNKTHNKVHIFH